MKLKINTPNGPYHYRYVPIYLGIKRIDKTIAKENLLIVKEILDSNHLTFILSFGALLGAVREHDFIDHDEDIDLIVMKKDMQRFLSLLFVLRDKGFEVVRYESRGFLSIMRKGEYIDFYFFADYPNDSSLSYCCRDMYLKKELEDLADIDFMGTSFKAPRNYEKYLEFNYGENWRTPVQSADFDMPAYKKDIFIMTQYLKAMLPTGIVEKIQAHSDAPYLEKWIEKAKQFK